MLASANKAQLPVPVSVPINEENAGQIEHLFDMLKEYQTDSVSLYLPHAKGRGWYLESKRLKKSTLEQLPSSVREHMPKVQTQSEAQWILNGEF